VHLTAEAVAIAFVESRLTVGKNASEGLFHMPVAPQETWMAAVASQGREIDVLLCYRSGFVSTAIIKRDLGRVAPLSRILKAGRRQNVTATLPQA
jgi:hypothetical protein